MLLLAVLLLFSSTARSEKYALKKIFQESKQAFESNDAKKNDVILRKFYFTDNKDQSIWHRGAIEWTEMYGTTLEKKDITHLQKNLERVFREYEICSKMPDGKPKAICFHRFYKILMTGAHDISFLTGEAMASDNLRAKFGIFTTAYAAMSVHLSLISMSYARYFEDKHAKKVVKEFLDLNHKNANTLHEYEKELRITRTDKVIPVTICQIVYHFWKEFADTCETRWRRSIPDDDDIEDLFETKTSLKGEKKEKIAKSDADIGFDIDLDDADPELNVADRLGDPREPGTVRFHGFVRDDVTGKMIYEKYETANSVSKANVMESLFKEGIEKRGSYVRDLINKLDSFDNDTVVQAREMIIDLKKNMAIAEV